MPRFDEHGRPHDELLEWAVDAQLNGILCLRALVLSIERGDAKLPIDPHAWDNTMAALEWMLTQHLAGEIHRAPPFTQQDLDRVRRVHLLGIEALSGGRRAPELGPLADQCLSSMAFGWRGHEPELPIRYPPPEPDELDA